MKDTIYREDAIKAVRFDTFNTLNADERELAINRIPSAEPSLKAIKRQIDEHWYLDAPSAEAVQGWRTGKPTKSGKYIVTLIGIGNYRFLDIMHYDKPCMPNREVSGACWYRYDDEWGDVVYDDKDILAWMPLPKPYREDGEV